MATKRKKKILRVIRRSCLTGKAIWISHMRSPDSERKAYRRVCQKEFIRMNQWSRTVARRRKNILQLLARLVERLPLHDDIPKEQADVVDRLARMADTEPSRQSDFYDHVCEERRRRRNARRREKAWQEKYGKGEKVKK